MDNVTPSAETATTTTNHPRGTKRSSMLTFRRRLLLVRLLIHEPMSSSDLIASVQERLESDGYPPAAAEALKHDLDALKLEYGCRISFDRGSGRYVLENLGELALLNLPDACMEALAFLEASFPSGLAMAEQANIRELLSRVVMMLPGELQEKHRNQRNAMILHLSGRTPGRIDPSVFKTIRRAIKRHQEIVFHYWSTFDVDQPREHRVAPYGIFFRPEGHGYLDATLMEVNPPAGETIHDTIHYRLDRVVPGSAKIVPNPLPAQRITPPTFTLRYQLLPVVARRRDVASYFPNTQITYHEDGSATVNGTVTNLWQARQVLLRYGSTCIVLDPPELVDMFRTTAYDLAQLYGVTGQQNGVGVE